MVRTEISLFLKNQPGELGRMARIFSDSGVNIEAMTIQDASEYVRNLFAARGRSIRRVASAANYSSMQKDSMEYALIRVIVNKTDEAIDILAKNGYVFDETPVIALELDNRPGILAEMSNTFGEHKINIRYVYGSALPDTDKALFIFCPEDMDLAVKILK